jgi:hypothetical protein
VISAILEALPTLLRVIPGLDALLQSLLDGDSDVRAEVQSILGDKVDTLERQLQTLHAKHPSKL